MKNIAGKSSSLLLATLFVVALSACNANQTKPESEAATATSATAEPAPAPVAKAAETKPVCKEEPVTTKSKTSKTKTKTSKTAAAPVDCVPASAVAPVAAAPAAAPAVQTANASGTYNLSKNKPVTDSTKVEAGQGTMVKGINDWEGEISGVPAGNSRLTRLKIGMSQQQVADLAGQPTDQGAYVTGKAFIPFYFGSDRSRWEMVYKGQGRLIFSNQSGFGTGYYLTWIIHNANEGGYR
jgi:hypothetical protein